MKISQIISYLESIAPLSLQESYDNSGLLIGSPEKQVNKALISLDITPEVMDEALKSDCNFIIAHHPLIFKGIKKLNGGNMVEDLVIKAIKNDIAIYAIHTNLDNVFNGVNSKLADILGLTNRKILSPLPDKLKKLIVFCPNSHSDAVREAMLESGAGYIGNYSHTSFNINGTGSYKPLPGSNPFLGEINKIHFEKETKIETIVPDYRLNYVISEMMKVHPYEEVAYDIIPLQNKDMKLGAGMLGELETPEYPEIFLKKIKKLLNVKALKHSPLLKNKINKIAICGGSGSFLMSEAAKQKADVFVTADLKYHDYFLYNGEMILVDAGHYETEQFTKELLFDLLTKKFPTFALQISRINTNPVSVL